MKIKVIINIEINIFIIFKIQLSLKNKIMRSIHELPQNIEATYCIFYSWLFQHNILVEQNNLQSSCLKPTYVNLSIQSILMCIL